MPLAVIDIDDVLSDTTPNLLRELNAKHGTDYQIDAMTTYYLWDSFNVPVQDVVSLILNPAFLGGCAPISGAAEATQRLKASGYEIWLITARPKELREMTEGWLNAGGFVYDNLVMGLLGSAKADALPAHADLAFEDNADTAISFAARADVVYLFTKPWNRDVDVPGNVRKIIGWDQVEIEVT